MSCNTHASVKKDQYRSRALLLEKVVLQSDEFVDKSALFLRDRQELCIQLLKNGRQCDVTESLAVNQTKECTFLCMCTCSVLFCSRQGFAHYGAKIIGKGCVHYVDA